MQVDESWNVLTVTTKDEAEPNKSSPSGDPGGFVQSLARDKMMRSADGTSPFLDSLLSNNNPPTCLSSLPRHPVAASTQFVSSMRVQAQQLIKNDRLPHGVKPILIDPSATAKNMGAARQPHSGLKVKKEEGPAGTPSGNMGGAQGVQRNAGNASFMWPPGYPPAGKSPSSSSSSSSVEHKIHGGVGDSNMAGPSDTSSTPSSSPQGPSEHQPQSPGAAGGGSHTGTMACKCGISCFAGELCTVALLRKEIERLRNELAAQEALISQLTRTPSPGAADQSASFSHGAISSGGSYLSIMGGSDVPTAAGPLIPKPEETFTGYPEDSNDTWQVETLSSPSESSGAAAVSASRHLSGHKYASPYSLLTEHKLKGMAEGKETAEGFSLVGHIPPSVYDSWRHSSNGATGGSSSGFTDYGSTSHFASPESAAANSAFLFSSPVMSPLGSVGAAAGGTSLMGSLLNSSTEGLDKPLDLNVRLQDVFPNLAGMSPTSPSSSSSPAGSGAPMIGGTTITTELKPALSIGGPSATCLPYNEEKAHFLAQARARKGHSTSLKPAGFLYKLSRTEDPDDVLRSAMVDISRKNRGKVNGFLYVIAVWQALPYLGSQYHGCCDIETYPAYLSEVLRTSTLEEARLLQDTLEDAPETIIKLKVRHETREAFFKLISCHLKINRKRPARKTIQENLSKAFTCEPPRTYWWEDKCDFTGRLKRTFGGKSRGPKPKRPSDAKLSSSSSSSSSSSAMSLASSDLHHRAAKRGRLTHNSAAMVKAEGASSSAFVSNSTQHARNNTTRRGGGAVPLEPSHHSSSVPYGGGLSSPSSSLTSPDTSEGIAVYRLYSRRAKDALPSLLKMRADFVRMLNAKLCQHKVQTVFPTTRTYQCVQVDAEAQRATLVVGTWVSSKDLAVFRAYLKEDFLTFVKGWLENNNYRDFERNKLTMKAHTCLQLQAHCEELLATT